MKVTRAAFAIIQGQRCCAMQKHVGNLPQNAPRMPLKFSVIRVAGCASAVAWFIFKHFHSEDSNQDRMQVAKIGAWIVFLEFLQDNRKPRPLGRLVNIFKLFVYFWWLQVATSMCQRIWSTIDDVDGKEEGAVFAVNALNFLILVKIWSQIEYLHQAFADVFSRFNLKAGTYISILLSLLGLHMSYDLAAASALKNSCDVSGIVMSRWFCHSSQPKCLVLFLFSSTLLVYLTFLQHNYKKTGKGFLPRGALINPDPSVLLPGDMVVLKLLASLAICIAHTAAGHRVRSAGQCGSRSCGPCRISVEESRRQARAVFVHHAGGRQVTPQDRLHVDTTTVQLPNLHPPLQA
jgi:hypothetical protein